VLAGKVNRLSALLGFDTAVGKLLLGGGALEIQAVRNASLAVMRVDGSGHRSFSTKPQAAGLTSLAKRCPEGKGSRPEQNAPRLYPGKGIFEVNIM
jgi:hypothetical protein